MENQTGEYSAKIMNWVEQLKSQLENYRNFLDEKEFITLDQKVHDLKQQITSNLDLNEQEIYDQALELHHSFRIVFDHDYIPIGKHRLPPLPYPYDALEPYIDEEIMRLHHLKHHQSYVDGLNKAEMEMEKARKQNNFELIKHWEREASFNGAGHYLHTIFWNIMSPIGRREPKGELRKAINQTFGNFNAMKKHFSEAAKQVEAVGWAILVWSPRSHRLEILQAEKHQNLSQWDVVPLLVLDVWEHAYYLQYKNDRAKYIENWWNVVNWDEVERRYLEARKLKWQPY